jgi:hypothetical protein
MLRFQRDSPRIVRVPGELTPRAIDRPRRADAREAGSNAAERFSGVMLKQALIL